MSSYGDASSGGTIGAIVLPTPPFSPGFGALWLNAVTGALSVWNGTAWMPVGVSTGAGGAAALPPAGAADQVLMSNAPGVIYSARSTINLGSY